MWRKQKRVVFFVSSVSLFMRSFFPPDPTFCQPKVQGFVRLQNGRELFYEKILADPDKPTVVVLLGMTYQIETSDRFFDGLLDGDINVIRVELRGQGKTLARHFETQNTLSRISYLDQVHDLHQFLEALKIMERVTLLGVSYGGSIALAFTALYPEHVRSTIMIAPYVGALPKQHSWIMREMAERKKAAEIRGEKMPSDRVLYAMLVREFLERVVCPLEPSLAGVPHGSEALVALSQGIYQFRGTYWARRLAKVAHRLPSQSLHLISAGEEEYMDRNDLKNLERAIPWELFGSHVVVNSVKHKILEIEPSFTMGWVRHLVLGGYLGLRNERVLVADPKRREIRSPSGKVCFKVVGSGCMYLLSRLGYGVGFFKPR